MEFKGLNARLAHLFKRCRNHRNRLFYSITRDIAYDHGGIYAEDIGTAEMIDSAESRIQRKLHRDAAWSTFMRMLSH